MNYKQDCIYKTLYLRNVSCLAIYFHILTWEMRLMIYFLFAFSHMMRFYIKKIFIARVSSFRKKNLDCQLMHNKNKFMIIFRNASPATLYSFAHNRFLFGHAITSLPKIHTHTHTSFTILNLVVVIFVLRSFVWVTFQRERLSLMCVMRMTFDWHVILHEKFFCDNASWLFFCNVSDKHISN